MLRQETGLTSQPMSESLMISVSGIRGKVGTDLTPEVAARYAAAFGLFAGKTQAGPVVLGRDARTSGPMFARAVTAGLQSVGRDVVDLGIAATPSVALAVEHHRAAGGIILTASHNPIEWNALKFLGADGVFLSAEEGKDVLTLAERSDLDRVGWDGVGEVHFDPDASSRHLDLLLALPLIDEERIRSRSFKVGLDCVRGAGGKIMPDLLARLGCVVVGLNLETDGRFPRPPEPIPENLESLGQLVRESGCDFGLAVDPDVDRLALVDGEGRAVGEDYTLALATEAVLAERSGPVVVNLSTSMVVDDAVRRGGGTLHRAPVGEAHVAQRMKEVGAVIGGEGNGGVMLPDLHLGRDAPLAAGLVLELLAREEGRLDELVRRHPRYSIVKAKIPRGPDVEEGYRTLETSLGEADCDRQDGLRLTWPDRWLHVRPSGTEPIIRIIAEAPSVEEAQQLVAGAKDALD